MKSRLRISENQQGLSIPSLSEIQKQLNKLSSCGPVPERLGVALIAHCEEIGIQSVMNSIKGSASLEQMTSKSILEHYLHKLQNSDFSNFDPLARDQELLRMACCYGHVELFLELLKYPGVDPTVRNYECLELAERYKQFQIYSLFMKDPRVNPPHKDHSLMISACADGDLERVKYYFSILDPTWKNNQAWQTACRFGHLDIIQYMMNDGRIDIYCQDHIALQLACQEGHLEVVQFFLKFTNLDPTADRNFAFRIACQEGEHKVVDLLLQDGRADPTAESNHAIQMACLKGQESVVKLLLSCDKINPAEPQNYAISNAGANGHTGVIKLLLEDHRADPDIGMVSAVEGGHVEAIKVLLMDTRTDPNRVLTLAVVKGDVGVVKLILGDGRTSIKNSNLSDPTPLYEACKNGNYEISCLLVEGGGDLWVEDSFKRRPLDLLSRWMKHNLLILVNWSQIRLAWIGYYQGETCLLSSVPKEIIFYIIEKITD